MSNADVTQNEALAQMRRFMDTLLAYTEDEAGEAGERFCPLREPGAAQTLARGALEKLSPDFKDGYFAVPFDSRKKERER